MTRITVAVPVFDGFTALDAVGPYEVLQRIPDMDVAFVGKAKGEVRTDNGMLGVTADATLAETSTPDIVVFPGGYGTRNLLQDKEFIEWVQKVHRSTMFTTSVCTGSLMLAAAGLLDGLTATSHWSAYDDLERMGAKPVGERVVEHLSHRVITSAGVSSGIDMALRLVELLVDTTAAEAAALMIEYDPQPPVAPGSYADASEAVMERFIQYAAARL